eukprot:3739436-Ditylum_brightwellii.AAC.1
MVLLVVYQTAVALQKEVVHFVPLAVDASTRNGVGGVKKSFGEKRITKRSLLLVINTSVEDGAGSGKRR